MRALRDARQMSEKDTAKVYRIVLSEALSFANAVASSKETIQSSIRATGSLGTYNQYYAEALEIVEKASAAGSMSPLQSTSLRATLDKWHGQSEEFVAKIVGLTKNNESDKLIQITKEIDRKVTSQQQMLQSISEVVSSGIKAWSSIDSFFDLKSSEIEYTNVFEGMAHKDLLEMLLKWIETRNSKTRLFCDIIHGPKESGIDIIARLYPNGTESFGMQLKNNDDVLAKDFATKLKAQITDSKKHPIKGLLVFFAAQITDPSIEAKIRSILSELSQIKERFIRAIPPEKTATIIGEAMNRS
jgi:hypothetical protein